MVIKVNTLSVIHEAPEEPTSSLKSKISFSFYGFGYNAVTVMQGSYFYFFYETELGLRSAWVSLSMTIFGIIMIFGNLLTGYIINKFRRVTKYGWGGPFLFGGMIIFIVSYILMFTDSFGLSEPMLFAKLLIVSTLYHFAMSFMNMTMSSVFVDIFRGDKDRRACQFFKVMIGTVGVLISVVLPPLIIKTGQVGTYTEAAILMALIGLIAILATFPSLRESPEKLERDKRLKENTHSYNIFESIRFMVAQKDLMLYAFASIGRAVGDTIVPASTVYLVIYVLKSDMALNSMVGTVFFLATVAFTPLFTWVGNKIGDNYKITVLSVSGLAFSTMLLFFATNIISLFALIIVYSAAQAFYDANSSNFQSDVYEQVIARTGRRDEPLYSAALFTISGTVRIFEALIFFVVHTAFGFVAGSAAQSETAILGIRLQISVFPAIFVITSVLIIIWKLRITKEKAERNRAKIRELQL
ncbi:MFS transporter [Brevibacillus fluminis]|uniref:MFS transporter n=1 Tax=Brevibacillus fluminis TaxID=511487 RepID=A0A3M8CV88_9BACL|nr:MFS transporter [Brevibacillus fluminis]RNB79742.1 MFS transporter [Brevibacillus fluminis]